MNGRVVSITAAALAELAPYMDEARCLYVRVAGVDGGEYVPALSVEPLAIAGEDDLVDEIGGVHVVIPAASLERLRGATIDHVRAADRTGFAVTNPNRPVIDEALAARVRSALEQHVNPGIAAHGGRADLVAVEGHTAYVRLSGGCQGCGMAAATLAGGIEATLAQIVPEIAGVVDVTDHAAGTNPYYAPR